MFAKAKTYLTYFSKTELVLWASSMTLIVLSFLLFDGKQYTTLLASLIGATSLIFNAKGNPFGQFLMILFGILYGYISYSFSYYGEMMTYLFMTVPMAIFSLISWLKNPYDGNQAEVRVNAVSKKEVALLFVAAVPVTLVFYVILKAFHTANLLPSTFSVATSFIAVYLTFRRNPYFAVAYTANDVVLIVLWILASTQERQYISVAVCFFAFLLNDVYTFLNWQKMAKRQATTECSFFL